MAEAVRERRSKTKAKKQDKYPKQKTKEKDKLPDIGDDKDLSENEPNVLTECQESQDNKQEILDQTQQSQTNTSQDDNEPKVESTELDTGQSSNVTTELDTGQSLNVTTGLDTGQSSNVITGQGESSNDTLPSSNQPSTILSENSNITEIKEEKDFPLKDDLDTSSHNTQKQDLCNPGITDFIEQKSKTQEEADVSESFHSAFSSVGEINDTSPTEDKLKTENRTSFAEEKVETENIIDLNEEKLKGENGTAKQVEDQNKELNTQVVSKESEVVSNLTETHTGIPQDVAGGLDRELHHEKPPAHKNLYPKLDLTLKQKDFTVKPEDLNVKQKDLNVKQKDLNVKPEDLNVRPKDFTVKPENLNVKPQVLNVKQESEIEVKQISQKRAKHQPLTLEQLHNLYYNPQLMENIQYIDRFIQNEIKKENHEFYEILSNYQRSRKSYVQAEEEIRALQQNYSQLQEQVWTTERSTITAKGTCGDGAHCKTTHMYDTSVFSDSVFKNLKKALESVRHNIQNQLALHSYSSQLARLQVESYIHGLYLSSPVFRDIPRNAPVQATENHSRDVQHHIFKLRECISVLFVFHRRPITDDEFENNLQIWTKKLVALLLRTASYEDHMFILNHVLRCPSGIGSWAANFVSVPMFMSSDQSSFGCPLLDHVMTGLATVLMPIKARTDFICLMSQSITPDAQQKNNWILVDSDGEEDEDPKNAWMYLHENDLVAILQQFPMSEVFQHVLLLTQDVSGALEYDIKRTRDSTFLKIIAFCTYLVNILSWGLQTYSMSRYKQLNKRIGRMIRQCVQYVSDHWENFEKHYKNLLPLDYILRIQVEYDQFFLRSTNSILTAQKLGSWQFMTDMPYSTVSKATMWQLLWLLHQKHKQGFNLESLPTEEECRKFISDGDSKMQLADIMQQLSVSEMIYLLTALSNMAQNRPAAELDFIQTVCLHLFDICYVFNETREMCSKVGRELLVSLATAHPFMLSLLIQRTHENMEHIGVMALYLFKELPFHLWLPQESDFAVIREWLLNSELTEPKNQLARMVLTNVNWDVDHERDRLFMPYDVHRQTAVLLVEAYGKFVINKQLGYFFIEGMKQVALAVRQQQTNEQQFNNWSWEVASKLHLHQSTFPKADLGLARASGGPPDLSKDNSLLPIIKGLKEKNVMACYAAIMISTVGHSDGLFLSEGLEPLQTLVEGHHYRPTLHILSCIAPIFYSMPQYLLDNHRFLTVIESLLAADDSMYKVAKIIWSHDFPGPVTDYFGCMTQKLLSDSSSQRDSNSTLSVIDFWIKVVTKINKWYQDKNCCYLIDLFVKSAFTCKVGIETIKPAFQDTMQAHIREASQQGVVQSIVSWVASGVNCASVPSLVEKMASPETFCWLSYVILDIESKLEIQSKLWPSICNELHSDHKMSPEQALKKSISRLKLESAPGINSLNIYRWGHLAMNIPFDHPVLPIVWQRFFVLFLGRLSSSSSVQQRASVGERFYDNSKERKKIRKRLGETCDFHMDYKIDQTSADTTSRTDQSENTENNQLENLKFVPKKEFHLELSRLFQTMQLWIEEPTLHDAKLYLPALPPQYQSDKLLQLFQNQTAPWLEFMNVDRIVYEQAQMTSEWMTSLQGDRTNIIPPDKAVVVSAKERILNRLKRHDSPLDPPPLQPDKALVPDVNITLFDDKQAIMHLLNSDLNTLKEYAKSFHVRISHHVAIDDDFCKLLPQLYYNKPTQVKVTIECKGIINPLHRCSNPAVVNVNIKEKAVDEIVQKQIDENRAEFKQKMIEGLNPPPQNVCVAAVHVENVITILVKLCRNCTDELRLSQYNDISCSLFFRLIEIMNDDVEFYPPSKQFFSSCIDLLGKEFIQKDASKTEHVLQLSLDCPNMAGHLSPHFVPINCPHLYISMYERLVQILRAKNPNLVFMLLTKFEIADWLKTKVPGTLELKRFSDVLGAALYSCGADPDHKHSMVFELYIRHLKALLRHQFPSNLNNVMNVVLQGTATQKIHVKAWEIIYSNCFPSAVTENEVVNRENDPFNILSIEQIKEILDWMGTFFLQVRISSADNANFGLYPKLKPYVPHIIQLQENMFLCLIQKIIPNLSDFNPSQTLDMLWTTAIEVFAPWIITLKTESQLLSPWIQTDVDDSQLVVRKFRSILDTFHQNFRSIIPPYQKDVLNMTWMYFTGNLCNKDTPKHVTKVYVNELIQLPWQQLKPDFHVLESMAKLKELNCEESFELLSHIVSEVDWTEILQFYQQYHPGEGLSIFMGHLLLFLMQCHGESKHIETPNIEQKMLQAEMYNWLPLMSDKFRHASNWFLQTCDPKCIQAERTSTLSLGLRLLKSASGFNVSSSGHWSSELSVKRQNYVHSIVQLICQCTYDTEVNMNTISTVLINLLTEIETVVGAVVDLRIQKEETMDLVKEVFSLLNNCNPDNRSIDIMTTTIYQWLQSSPNSILLLPSIQASSRCLASHKQIVHIVEECIQVYFKGGLDQSDGGGWDQVLAAIQIPDMNVEEFLDTALEEGSYLLLYGYIVLKLPLCQKLSGERELIVQLLDWSEKARPTPETESRLILWWFKIMEMILRQIDYGLDQSSCIKLLQRFVAILHQQGKERESGGILGAIGFGKHSPLTPQFRIFARALSAMILLQIYGDSVLRLNPEEELANTSYSKSDVGTLQSMKTSKQYQSFKSEIEIAIMFVTDRSNCLRHAQELIHNLSMAFYQDKEFLSVVHHQGD